MRSLCTNLSLALLAGGLVGQIGCERNEASVERSRALAIRVGSYVSGTCSEVELIGWARDVLQKHPQDEISIRIPEDSPRTLKYTAFGSPIGARIRTWGRNEVKCVFVDYPYRGGFMGVIIDPSMAFTAGESLEVVPCFPGVWAYAQSR